MLVEVAVAVMEGLALQVVVGEEAEEVGEGVAHLDGEREEARFM